MVGGQFKQFINNIIETNKNIIVLQVGLMESGIIDW